MDKGEFVGVKSPKLRKFFASGLTAVFSAGMCGSSVGNATQVAYQNVELVDIIEKQQAVEDDVVMLPETYDELMKGANVSQDLLSRVRTRDDNTVAMPESLYEKFLTISSASCIDGIEKQQAVEKSSFLEKSKAIFGVVKKSFVNLDVERVLGIIAGMCLILRLALFIVAMRSYRSGAKNVEADTPAEGMCVGSVEQANVEDTVARAEVEQGDSADGKAGASGVAEKIAVSAASVGGVSSAGVIVNSLLKKDGAESAENVEGPFVFLNNSSSGSNTSVSKNEEKSKSKKSAVVIAPASAA